MGNKPKAKSHTTEEERRKKPFADLKKHKPHIKITSVAVKGGRRK